MAKVCELTGIRPLSGHLVSHSNIKTKTRRLPNLKKKKFEIPQLGKTLTLTLSTRAIRTIDHQGGIARAILQAKEENMSSRLLRLRHELKKTKRSKSKKTSS